MHIFILIFEEVNQSFLISFKIIAESQPMCILKFPIFLRFYFNFICIVLSA